VRFYIDCPNCGHCIDLQGDSDKDADILKQGRKQAWDFITGILNGTDIPKETSQKSIQFL
jgi:hypothetical protein